MSSRQGWEYTAKVQVEEMPSPNHQNPYVSAHVRVFWPFNATDEQVLEALKEAFEVSAYQALARKHGIPKEEMYWTEEQVEDIHQRAKARKAELDGLTE